MAYTIKLQEGWDLTDLKNVIQDYEVGLITEDELFAQINVEGEKDKDK